MNIIICAIPCDSTGLVDHFLSYLCRLNADSLSFTDHQKADVCMGVVRRLLGLSGYVMGASDTNGAIIPPVHDELFIPFKTSGCTVHFESYVPSDEDLENYPHIVLSDDECEWDPNGVQMSSNRPYRDVRIKEAVIERNRRCHVPVECETDLCLGSIYQTI